MAAAIGLLANVGAQIRLIWVHILVVCGWVPERQQLHAVDPAGGLNLRLTLGDPSGTNSEDSPDVALPGHVIAVGLRGCGRGRRMSREAPLPGQCAYQVDPRGPMGRFAAVPQRGDWHAASRVACWLGVVPGIRFGDWLSAGLPGSAGRSEHP